MMSDQRGTALTADAWRRICNVLDRLHDVRPELRDAILENACREQGLTVDEVRPFADANERSDALPQELPFELMEEAFVGLSPDASPLRLRAGQKLGPYEIGDSLGAGGMGEVYRATDSRLGRTVAIKVLRPHLLQSAEARQRFDQEARAVSRLNHPLVCTLYDVGHQDGIDFLVMEYVEGETLAERLQRGAIPLAQAIRLAPQIADALHRAHRLGIVHRDLKPANIILTRGSIKLLDLGLAQLDVGEAADDGGLTGTPQYMPPEQVERRQVDARGDIFACGAVLYEMISGRRAFTGRSQADVMGAILHEHPTPVAQLVPHAPPSLDWTLSRCLAKDPEDRWQSAGDLKPPSWYSSTPDSATHWRAPASPTTSRQTVGFCSGCRYPTTAHRHRSSSCSTGSGCLAPVGLGSDFTPSCSAPAAATFATCANRAPQCRARPRALPRFLRR